MGNKNIKNTLIILFTVLIIYYIFIHYKNYNNYKNYKNYNNKLTLTLNDYKKYNVIKRSNLKNMNFIVDTNVHFRPYGGEANNFSNTINFLRNSNILMCIITGIGQRLPFDSKCNYYLDCPGVPVKPSIINDVLNAIDYKKYRQLFENEMIVILSMSFLDLHKPEKIPLYIELLDNEFPGLFKCVGEVNLCKEMLINNKLTCIQKETIPKWKSFMKILEIRKLPIIIHSDIGNNNNNLKYIDLFKTACDLYPNNKIIWAHMGLSKELTNIEPYKHLNILSTFLDNYPNLYIDITWRILYDNVFKYKNKRDIYVPFINKYYNRILPGTDFVNSINKNQEIYKQEHDLTSYILNFVDNNAYRHIALGQNFINIFELKGLTAPYVID
jgi:hypothetical protein